MLFLALAILLCGFVPGRVDAASLVKDATLTVKQTVTGSPNGTSEKFEYELKALTTGAPMPVGSSGDSYRFTLNGNESKDLVITYDTVDTYKYQLSQVVTSDKKDYDRQVYTIENYVMQNGSEDFLVKTAIKRKDGNKSPTLSFTIQHKAEDETPVKNTASVPKSGDDQSFISLIVLILSALLIIVVYKWKKNRRV